MRSREVIVVDVHLARAQVAHLGTEGGVVGHSQAERVAGSHVCGAGQAGASAAAGAWKEACSFSGNQQWLRLVDTALVRLPGGVEKHRTTVQRREASSNQNSKQ